MRYSIFALVSNAFSGHRKWSGIIHQEKLKPAYDIVIVGAGGHGLATAHYLANNHDINDVLVLDAGWIGGGNTGKNTTIVRSDYLLNASFQLKNFALGLWRSLSRELDFNLMYSPRGYVDLAHSDAEMEHFTLRANSMRLRGGDANILTRDELAVRVPGINLSRGSRYPVSGALVQEAGGVVRHDAVSWGFARSASSAGIHIMQDCPLTGFKIKNQRVVGVKTAQQTIRCGKVLVSVAGASTQVADLAGIELPLESINVQAFVSEPVKPALDTVVNYNAGLSYISQTDKGEFVLGGATDGYPSCARRGSFVKIEDTLARALQIFPYLANMRLMRHWSGTADISMDGNAIVGPTPIENLFFNCGWGYAGFKATPAVGWAMAKLLATEEVPGILQPFSLDRFECGALIDDAGVGPYPWLQ